MKDKRNCGAAYPVYPQPIMPPMGIPTPYMAGYNQGYSTNSISSNTMEQSPNNLEQQINNLNTRVTKLESMISQGNTTNYNDTNYYMV